MRETKKLKTEGNYFGLERSNTISHMEENNSSENILLDEAFGNFLKKLLKFKIEFDRKYYEKTLLKTKFHLNIQLEIILAHLKQFKERHLLLHSQIIDETIYESPLSLSRFDIQNIANITPIQKNKALKVLINAPEDESLIDNFEKFERILEILIKTSPEELFREIKSLILNEYDQTKAEIQKYLEKNRNDDIGKFFNSMSQIILFTISKISFKMDYYSIAVNSLVEKLNKFVVSFIESASKNNLIKNQNNKVFLTSLNMVQKFIKIKKIFVKDFCFGSKDELNYVADKNNFNNPSRPTSPSKKTFSFHKFGSFGRYFFKNILTLLNIDIKNDETDITPSKKSEFKLYSLYKKKSHQGRSNNIWKDYKLIENNLNVGYTIYKTSMSKLLTSNSNLENNLILDKSFKLYFTSKIANWKYISFQQKDDKKIEICRICEMTFDINEFVLHIFYCKDEKIYNQNINDINNEIGSALNSLKHYRETLLKESNDGLFQPKDQFFSPKSEFNRRFRQHYLEKTPKVNNRFTSINKYTKEKSEVELLDTLVQTISKEREKTFEHYEKNPYKLSQLLSMLHFSLFIFVQNKNCIIYSDELNKIFAKLVINLMKKINFVEYNLTLNDNKERAKNKIKFYYEKKFRLESNNNSPSFRVGSSSDKNVKIFEEVENKNFDRNSSRFSSAKMFAKTIEDVKSRYKQFAKLSHPISNQKILSHSPNQKLNSLFPSKTFNNGTNRIGIDPNLFNKASPRANVIKAVSNELKLFSNINKDTNNKYNNPFTVISRESVNNNETTIQTGSHIDSPFIFGKTSLFTPSQSQSPNNNTNLTDENTKKQNHAKKSLFGFGGKKAGNTPGTTNIITDPIAVEMDSSIDSEISFNIENKRKTINENANLSYDMETNEINENDEVDSQIDEIAELMDEIQISDPTPENMTIIKDENEGESSSQSSSNQATITFQSSAKTSLSNIVKITDFKLIRELASGGYGRVDIYKKITTGDLYAIKTVNIKKMVNKNFVICRKQKM